MLPYLHMLGQASTTGVLALESLGGALQRLTPKQLANIIATNNQTLGVKALTTAQITEALTIAGIDDATSKETLAILANIAALEGQDAATKKNIASHIEFNAVMSGLKKTLLAHPLLLTFAGIAVAIGIATWAYKKFVDTAEKHVKAFEELKGEYDSVTTELTSLESELTSVRDRIKELNDFAKAGQLTPDQEVELKQLKATNEELERKLAVQKELAEITEKQLEQEAYQAIVLTKYTREGNMSGKFTSDVGLYPTSQFYQGTTTEVISGAEKIRDLIGDLEDLNKQREELGYKLKSKEISEDDYKKSLADIETSYTSIEGELGNVVAEQQALADGIKSTSGAAYEEKKAIEDAIDAFMLFTADTTFEKLELMLDDAPSRIATAGDAMRQLAEEMDNTFGDGNVDLKIEPVFAVRDDGTVATNDFITSVIGDEDAEYAIHFTPVWNGEALDDDYVKSYLGNLLDQADSLDELLELDQKARGLILGVHENSATASQEEFVKAENEWRDGLQSMQTEYNSLVEALQNDGAFMAFAKKAVEQGIIADTTAASLLELANILHVLQHSVGGAAGSISRISFTNVETSAGSAVKAIKDAQKDMTEGNYLTADSVKALEEAGLDEYLVEVADGHKLAQGALEDYLKVQRSQYLSAVNDALNAAAKLVDAETLKASGYNTTTMSIEQQVHAMHELAQAELAVLGSDIMANSGLAGSEAHRYLGNNAAYLAAVQKVVNLRKSLDNLNTFDSSIDTILRDYDSSSSKSSDPWKEQFEAEYNAWKHMLDMEQITLKEFYDWLDGTDGYKKYFANQKKYLDEFRKYEKEVLEGRRKQYEDDLSDLDYEADILGYTEGNEEKIVDIYRQKQELLRDLIAMQEAYLLSLGATNEEIAKNDIIQDYTKQWYQLEKEILSVEKEVHEEKRDYINDLIDLTKDMIKQEQEDMIDALEDQKDFYKEIIELRKELLDLAERERSYNEEVAEKTKEISKLQSRIETLRLDDSRAAALERAELEQELAELQKELADTQREHSIESTEDALDKELEDFEAQQDAKIKEIEDFLDDNEKLHKEALNRLEGFNQSFYSNLERYAKKYTDTTSAELTKMWDEAKKAAEEYGTLAGAYNHYSNDFDGTVGDFNASADTNSKARSIVARMRANSINWQFDVCLVDYYVDRILHPIRLNFSRARHAISI